MEVIMRLNTWANMCGHFFNACLDSAYEDRETANNGYNCKHPEQEEEQDGIGCCYRSSCPTAYPADGRDCVKFGVECSECGNADCECFDDMMVCEIKKEDFDERYMWKEKI